jgi:hypothetical protein
LDRRISIQVAICVLYMVDILALPVSHLSFWILTAVFAGASFEAGIGISIYRRLAASGNGSVRFVFGVGHTISRLILS